ncbi:sensor histidine kinase [Hymenobacter arizonensis]|uniref:Histidine kinase n=1 Tax=Hymenobacter arizonensis TaxID=1227077 RepID=A0A1I5ZM31_HYMAR|nr:sensor histidine kinase [Hymenobacter arizonensis]SFQ57519.1 Histidine kinase [Hymenobacter arizonensis]
MTFAHFFRRRAVRHGIVWLLVFGICEVLSPPSQGSHLKVFGRQYSLALLSVTALAIYVHYWLLTHLLEQRRYALYAVATVATLLAGGALLLLVEHVDEVNFVHFRMSDAKAPVSWAFRLGEGAGNVLFGLIMATIARYVRRGIVSHFQMQKMRALQLETELSLLKAQVNQHFLFNTLNNLYGLSLAAPDQMPEALLQLAGLMRYQLDSSRQSAVTVGTEAEYLANYIGLEKLRLRHNTQVEFTVDLPRPEQPLAPLLLLPLVENCFKHAIGPSGENTIHIHLTQSDVGLTLRTGNSIPPHFRATPSGLGLPTLRARLAQYYPGKRHRLDIKATDTFYATNLQLVL